jgi:deoxyadenosine/deoxycytidine kinase
MIFKPLILSLEGNIGSGKSTMLENLQKKMKDHKNIIFLKEPLDVWESIKDSDGENILKKFYKDPKKYAFSFQVMAYATRLKLIKDTVKENPLCSAIICERSLEADRKIFAKMLFDDGILEDVEYQIYNTFCNEMSNVYGLDGMIYIETDPEICLERITKRSRQGEEGITLEYLQKCHNYHNNWLNKESLNGPILKINTNTDVAYNNLYNSLDTGTLWLCQIEKFIDENIIMENVE